MSALTEQVRKALEGFNNSRLDKDEIEYFADNAPTWLAQLCDRVETLESSILRISGMCGTPNAVEGCQNILKVAKEALRDLDGPKA